jgi:nucleoside-diphosphate-sugar epimerase
MWSAAKGENNGITFGGKMQFHYASDVALQFIVAAENPLDGAYVFNLGTPAVAVQEVANIIMKIKPEATITVEENILPFPEACDPSELHKHFDTVYETPLEDAIAETIRRLARLSE